MTPEEFTYQQLNNESESGLRAELDLYGYKPSPIINKKILVSMLMNIYFGGEPK
jgi:hypothetical protein